ncbi:hypothetical protein ACIF80_16945 [Streptomyces sp. NPDC085927]|uniref:hypothetical protein n=1 Tax=Streptomyces sp. NPDC085927 TaxID=3365738 RepID=UPI0037D03E99
MTGIEQKRQRAILDPHTAAERFRLDHEPTPADLTPFVDGYRLLPHEAAFGNGWTPVPLELSGFTEPR